MTFAGRLRIKCFTRHHRRLSCNLKKKKTEGSCFQSWGRGHSSHQASLSVFSHLSLLKCWRDSLQGFPTLRQELVARLLRIRVLSLPRCWKMRKTCGCISEWSELGFRWGFFVWLFLQFSPTSNCKFCWIKTAEIFLHSREIHKRRWPASTAVDSSVLRHF